MKKITGTLIAALLAVTSLTAQDAPETSVDVALDISTNYIWRGLDLYESKFAADKVEKGAFVMVPSFMPSLTVYTPIEGLWLNVWGGFAATDREFGADGTGAGLAELDEVDYTIGYDFENSVGSWSLAYIIFSYPALGGSYEELVFSYVADLPLSPTFGAAVSTASGTDTEYVYAGIGHSIEAGKIAIEPSVTFGYWFFNGSANSNFSHIDIALPVSFAASDNLSIGLTALAVIRNMNDTSYIPATYVSNVDGTSVVDTPTAIFAITFGVAYSM